MASQRLLIARAGTSRRDALSLANAFSIGLKSGALGKTVDADGAPRKSLDPPIQVDD